MLVESGMLRIASFKEKHLSHGTEAGKRLLSDCKRQGGHVYAYVGML